MRPQLEATGMEKAFGTRMVLKGIDLTVDAGETFVIIGPTGSGKTTLLHILGLLEGATGGTLRLLGTDCTCSEGNHLALRRRMAFVQQKPIAFNMSLRDNIAQPLRWRGLAAVEREARVEEMLQATGMTDYARRNALTLSGGETQRLAIARALVCRPEILLLDEPTANLDPESALRVEEMLEGVARQRQTTVVMTTHDLAQAGRLADRVGVLVEGEMRRVGTPLEVRDTVEREGPRAASQLFSQWCATAEGEGRTTGKDKNEGRHDE